jgi:hypothetical protein
MATTLTLVMAALHSAVEGVVRSDGRTWARSSGTEVEDDLAAPDIDGRYTTEYRQPLRSLRWTGLTDTDVVEAKVDVLLHDLAVGDARTQETTAMDNALRVAHAIEGIAPAGLEWVAVEDQTQSRDADDLITRLAVTLRFQAALP